MSKRSKRKLIELMDEIFMAAAMITFIALAIMFIL